MLRRKPTRIELKQEDVDEFERVQREKQRTNGRVSESEAAYRDFSRKREQETKARVTGTNSN